MHTRTWNRRRFRRSSQGSRATDRRAFTLVELLVGTTVTLLVILALTEAFATVSATIVNSRAMLELTGQLRSTSARLQADLDAIPGPIVPFQPSGAARGFVEYGDGPLHDLSGIAIGDSSLGDTDDYLQFLAESTSSPFTGRFSTAPGAVNSTLIHANQAEIAWWAHLNDLDGDNLIDAGETFNLYRRVLLIRPDVNGTAGYFLELPSATTFYSRTSQADLRTLHGVLAMINNEIDISWHAVRIENGNNVRIRLVANSVSNLSFRQNRFAHDIIVSVDNTTSPPTYTYNGLPAAGARPFPYGFVAGFDATYLQLFEKQGDRIGEDLMLSNVLAFDVRAFDPLAAVSIHQGVDGAWGVAGLDDDNNSTTDDVSEAGWVGSDDEAVGPGDLSYGQALTGSGAGAVLVQLTSGAFVDLNYLGKRSLNASQIPASHFRLTGGQTPGYASLTTPLYDTWTLDYESNVFDDDGDGLVDEATNGSDDNSIYGADDAQERETSPPYPVDLRGLQVRIRILDRDTRQVRQSTISSDYTPD